MDEQFENFGDERVQEYDEVDGSLARKHASHEREMLRLQSILDNTVDALITIDQSGMIEDYNPACERIFGYSANEVLGRNVRMLMTTVHAERHDGYLQHYLTTGSASIIGAGREVEGRHKDGSSVPLELAVSEIRFGGCRLFCGILRDVTERKKIEAEHQTLLDQTAQALQRERELNALQRQFVSMISHEFRTPLAIIDGIAQRLIRKGDKVELGTRNDQLQKVRGSANRLIGLMESVLNSAQLEAGVIDFNPAEFDLRALVQEACDNQQEISDEHKIMTDIKALPQAYIGDAKLLYQVIMNLLSNAVKYSPDGKVVHVTGAIHNAYAMIAVRDHGVGIPENEMPKLFQRFFRASTSAGFKGTGIGLNMVKALVEMHSGSIDVTSIMGQGSTFTIELPYDTALI